MTHGTKKTAIWLTLTVLAAMIAACVGTPPAKKSLTDVRSAPITTGASTDSNPSITALAVARDMLGVPYRYGGRTPRGFDCSGLVQYSFGRVGVRLPRTAAEIFRRSRPLPPASRRAGDLLFFTISSNKVSHVGIYAGNDRFIHAPSSGKGVGYASLNNPYWRKRLVAVGRI